MTETRSFPIEVILSGTHRHMLCEFSKVHEFIEFVCGEPVWTHQLPRVFPSVREGVLKQHPQLAQFSPEGCNGDNWQEYVRRGREMFGASLEIEHCSASGYEPIHPLDEQNLQGKEVITITMPESDK